MVGSLSESSWGIWTNSVPSGLSLGNTPWRLFTLLVDASVVSSPALVVCVLELESTKDLLNLFFLALNDGSQNPLQKLGLGLMILYKKSVFC